MKYGKFVNEIGRNGANFTKVAIASIMANSVSTEVCESGDFEIALNTIYKWYLKSSSPCNLVSLCDIVCDVCFDCGYGFLEDAEPSIENLEKEDWILNKLMDLE